MIIGRRKASSPGTYIDPSVELSCDGSLIFLDTLGESLRLAFPTVSFRANDGFALDLGGLYAFPQAIDLVDRQSSLSEEQIAHGDE